MWQIWMSSEWKQTSAWLYFQNKIENSVRNIYLIEQLDLHYWHCVQKIWKNLNGWYFIFPCHYRGLESDHCTFLLIFIFYVLLIMYTSESCTIRPEYLWINGVSLVWVGSGRMRVMDCVLCDRCVSADGGEWRLSVSCGHPSLHEARRPPQLPAVLQTRRRARGECTEELWRGQGK